MAIKPDAAKYFLKYPGEREIATRLDEVFDITFRAQYGGYSVWLADAKPNARERFGFEQEVLVLYSVYHKTDQRALTTIESIVSNPEFKHRVEKVVFLLIHCGTDDEADAVVRNSADRIIVPIHVDELKDPGRGPNFVRSRIAKSIGSVDLYGMTSAIRSDKYFFGRNELVQNLISRSTQKRENCGLFGLRKTGKTSVLRAVQRRIDGKYIHAEYVECSNPGFHAARWWKALENLIERCRHSLARKLGADIPVFGKYRESDAGTRFAHDVNTLLHTGKLEQLILMLDEIEFITHGVSGTLGQHWDQDFAPFWQSIRSTHQETQGGLTFFVAGVNPTCVEKSHFGSIPNPIFQLAPPYYLEPFKVEQVREMVRSIGRYAGLAFEESVYQYLQSTYGGHPFLIRIACSEIWKACDKQNSSKIVNLKISNFEALHSQIRDRLSAPIKDILLSLVWWYPEDYDLLLILAAGDTAFVSDYIKQSSQAMFQIAKYGLLKSDGSNEFAITDLREFLNLYGEAYKNEVSPFSRSDMPPELLPEIPDLEVVGRLFQKRTEVELKLRKAIMTYFSVKFTFDQQQIALAIGNSLPIRRDRPSPQTLLIGRQPQDVLSQLYVPDLKEIILKNWDIFAPLFDSNKDRCAMNLDTLNIARRVDAHTKPVSNDELADFENSYAWLSARLAKINI